MNNLVVGSVVMMSVKSGVTGYGNPQCVSDVCEPLGEIGLYGHNQHYKIHDVQEVVSSPASELESTLLTVQQSFNELGRELVGQTFGEEHNLLDLVNATLNIKEGQ